MTPPSSPVPSSGSPPPPPSATPRRSWRTRASRFLWSGGLVLIVASAFLPWIEVSIQRTLPLPAYSTDTVYRLWDVAGWYEVFPVCVGVPLLVIVWSLLNHRAGRPNFGRVGLVVLCLAGVGGTFLVLLLAAVQYGLHGGGMGFGRTIMSVDETVLLGFWTCVAGYGLLIVGALLFGYPLRIPRRREAQ